MFIEWLEYGIALGERIVAYGGASVFFSALSVLMGWFALSHAVTAFRLAFGSSDNDEEEPTPNQ